MWKKIVLLVVLAGYFSASAQRLHQVGVSVGASNFLGDLGGANLIGSPWYLDTELKLFFVAGAIHYRYQFNRLGAIRVEFMGTQLKGDDRLIENVSVGDDAWFRRYRNLHFKSILLELSVMGEIDVLRYKKLNKNLAWTPFLTGGVGAFYFNPKAQYNGHWVALQPLGTEGQGTAGNPKKYSRIQPSFIVGGGVKYNINRRWQLGLEWLHRFTITDYIDDVSTVYADPATLSSQMTIDLANRSVEYDPEGRYSNITAPGQQRGDPKDKDQYYTIMLKATYSFLPKGETDCFYSKKRYF